MVKYRAGALCLIGILTATYLHSTTFMSQFFYHSLILGGIAAFAIDAGVVAIDAGVVAMSIFKDELLKDGELAWMVRIVTSVVLFASGVANMAEGFKSAYGITLTYATLSKLDPLTWIQWLAGTIIFPILAYVMCDTIGTRNLAEFREQQRRLQSSPSSNGVVYSSSNGSYKQASSKNGTSKEKRKQMLKKYLATNPNASLAEMASAIGVSSGQTVRKYLDEIGYASQYAQQGAKFSAN
jgi:hypothetical protein